MIFGRRQRERELNEEIQAHLRLAEQDGHSPESARREFGNITLVKETARDVWGWRWMEDFMTDVRYAIRQLRKSPGFAAAAIVSIGLGIGGTTAMFSVIRAVLLKPLAYREPDRLLVSGGITTVRYDEMKTAARSFVELGDFLPGAQGIALSGGASPEVLKAAAVSANFLRILDVEPLLGRGFRPDEEAPGAPAVTIISADLWQRRFGGDPSVVGKTVNLAATAYTVVGVLPPGFQFPFADADVWVARPAQFINTTSPILTVFGRLKPGVSTAQANAEGTVLKDQYAKAHPGMLDAKPGKVVFTPLKERLVADAKSMIWMLFGAIGFVLLIACANVASLMLARAAFRAREFAVRAALGAARGRLLVQLLTESLLLAFAGGALGVLLAAISLRGLESLTALNLPALNLPRLGEVRLDAWVLAFAVLLSIFTGVLFGLAPAIGASRPDLIEVLRSGGEGGSPIRGRFPTGRTILVTGQLALSLVLLIGAALLMESLAHYNREDLGFNTAHLLTLRLSLPPTRYDTPRKIAAFHAELVRRVESLPGIRAASVMFFVPMTTFAGMPVQDAARPRLKLNERPIATIQNVSPAYFTTMQIPLRSGRVFTEHDTLDAPLVAVVDETLARNLWPDRPDAVGQRVFLGTNPKPLEIVGVVGAIHQNLEFSGWPGIYRPSAQSPQPSVGFAVRTEGDPARYINAVRGQVLAIDRDQPVSAVRTMDELRDDEMGQRRWILWLLESFAGTALLLAVIGIYGVIAYSVAQRSRELGIRQAVGAQRSHILRLVLKQGLFLALAGVAAGIAGAYALTRVMKSLLFGVSATDPATFAVVALLFVVVALAASCVPARRATRIDPMAVLRVG